MSAPTITVETRTETLRRVLSIRGAVERPWEFSCWASAPDDEPRISATEAARRLGYAQPLNAKQTVERIFPENKRPHVVTTVMKTSMPRGGTREVKVRDYQLTEAELLKFIARSETPIAEAILDEIIAVYMAVRRHLVATVPVKAHERKPPQLTPSQRFLPPAGVQFRPPTGDLPPPDLKPQLPAPTPSALQPAPTAPALVPLAQRLTRPCGHFRGQPFWNVAVSLSAQEVFALRSLANGRTVEDILELAVSGFVLNALALGTAKTPPAL